ncbi:MAG: hypothetical protein RJB11_163 [Planctomycetota bacterium]
MFLIQQNRVRYGVSNLACAAHEESDLLDRGIVLEDGISARKMGM